MQRPNLFIIGAAKCGTTSLHSYLAQHPQIYMSELKEPCFFLEPHERHPTIRSGSENNDLELYLRLFVNDKMSKFAGESSSSYTKLPKSPGVAQRIYAFNPDAYLIYIIRDPIERTISHYWWNVQHESEYRDIMTAIIKDPCYCDVSYYAMQIKPYLEIFASERLKVLTLEELIRDPQRTIVDIFTWLGVDTSISPCNYEEKKNVTPEYVIQQRSKLLYKFRYSKFWNSFGPCTPQSLRTIARRGLEKTVNRRSVNQDEVVSYLRPIQKIQTEELSDLLKRDFPEWQCFQ